MDDACFNLLAHPPADADHAADQDDETGKHKLVGEVKPLEKLFDPHLSLSYLLSLENFASSGAARLAGAPSSGSGSPQGAGAASAGWHRQNASKMLALPEPRL